MLNQSFHKVLIALAGLAALTACGFKPIYATTDQDGVALVQRISIGNVTAPENVEETLIRKLNSRLTPKDGEAPRYVLEVAADELAAALAIQIDASVTRFNYRLNARYGLTNTETGETIRGVAQSVTSYNIVTSQYSTLYAEREAIEKAATALVEEIERDILLRFAASATDAELEQDKDEKFLEKVGEDPTPGVTTEDERIN